MKKIAPGFILPSAALTISPRRCKLYEYTDKAPEIGDLVYGRIVRLGQHSELENQSGRIHSMNDGSRAVFVFGNRYAPDYYEGYIPCSPQNEVDLLARSGVIGNVTVKNASIKDPTRVKVLGYVVDEEGKVLNTRQFPLFTPHDTVKRNSRSKLVLVVGTAMNSGKSTSAVACCWALSTMGHGVRASKITGTASLKDILHMQDAGAQIVIDFSHLGYPSTFMLSEEQVLDIFDQTDLKYANNSRNYWVVELADGILQRETAMLLAHPHVQGRIHRLVFAAHDTFGAIAGIDILRHRFNLVPDAISGVCSGSPLAIQELREFTNIPVFNNRDWDLKLLSEILL